MTTKRILPADVIAAYREEKLRPKVREITPTNGRCCGLGAISASLGLDPESTFDAREKLARAGYALAYLGGWWQGFDGYSLDGDETRSDFRLGHADGRAAAEAVFAMDWEKA